MAGRVTGAEPARAARLLATRPGGSKQWDYVGAMRTFWQEPVLSLVGPVLTAIVGTASIGIWAARVTRQWQERKEDALVRQSLIRELLESAGAFYVALRHYSRVEAASGTSDADRASERHRLDEAYLHIRKIADATEYRLRAIFVEESIAQSWHALIDLLTVPYFKIIYAADSQFMLESAGPEHSTLTIEELEDDNVIYKTYKATARTLPSLILAARRRSY